MLDNTCDGEEGKGQPAIMNRVEKSVNPQKRGIRLKELT